MSPTSRSRHYVTGTVQEGEARVRLVAAVPTIRLLASAIVAASATILALMLTLLGLTHSHEEMFSELHYRRVRILSAMSVAALVGSVFLFMLLSIPVTESERLRGFYAVAYYIIVGASAVVGREGTTQADDGTHRGFVLRLAIESTASDD